MAREQQTAIGLRPRLQVIRSDGQSGVDRAAIDCAIAAGLAHGGCCPRGGLALDYPELPGLVAKYPALTETPSRQPEQRTAWNVRDSHATLLIVCGDELERSPCTLFTQQMAELVICGQMAPRRALVRGQEIQHVRRSRRPSRLCSGWLDRGCRITPVGRTAASEVSAQRFKEIAIRIQETKAVSGQISFAVLRPRRTGPTPRDLTEGRSLVRERRSHWHRRWS